MEPAEVIERFRSYLRIKTVQPTPDYEECVEFLSRVVPGKPMLIMTLPGKRPDLQSILCTSHMDVVPVSAEKWEHDPFAAEMTQDGHIYARGSQDMKCVGMAYLEAIRFYKATDIKLRRTIHLTFVPDEEIGSADGMKQLVHTEIFKKLNVGVALDEGVPTPTRCIPIFHGERAVCWITVVAQGNAGHGSALIQGTAIEKMLRVLDKAMAFRRVQEKLLVEERGLLGRVTSLNINGLRAGKQINVIPDMVEADLDVRISYELGLESFQKLLDEWTSESGVSYLFVQKNPLLDQSSIEPTDRWWSTITNTLAKNNIEFMPAIFPGGTDSRFIRAIGIPTYGISPFRNTPILLHDHNECLNGDVYLDGIEIYKSLIMNLANAE